MSTSAVAPIAWFRPPGLSARPTRSRSSGCSPPMTTSSHRRSRTGCSRRPQNLGLCRRFRVGEPGGLVLERRAEAHAATSIGDGAQGASGRRGYPTRASAIPVWFGLRLRAATSMAGRRGCGNTAVFRSAAFLPHAGQVRHERLEGEIELIFEPPQEFGRRPLDRPGTFAAADAEGEALFQVGADRVVAHLP